MSEVSVLASDDEKKKSNSSSSKNSFFSKILCKSKDCPLRKGNSIVRKVILLSLIVLGIFALVISALYLLESTADVKDVRITNETGTSVTVSWITDEPVKGTVLYSTENSWNPVLKSSGKERAYDDRDVEEVEYGRYELKEYGKYYVHHVTLRDLEPDTRYYYRISTGMKTIDPRTYYPSFETGPVISDLRSPEPMYGMIKDHNENDLSSDALVFMTVYYENTKTGFTEESAKYSVVSQDGSYSFDMMTVRKKFGDDLFVESGKKYYENIEAYAHGYERDYLQIDGDEDQPAATLLLDEKDKNEKNSLKDFLISGVSAEETTEVSCTHPNDTGVELARYTECCACGKEKEVVKCEGKDGYDQFHWSPCNRDTGGCQDMCPPSGGPSCANGDCDNPGGQINWCDSRYCDNYGNWVCREKYCDSDSCIQYKPGRFDTCTYGCEEGKGCKDGDTSGGSGGTCENQQGAPNEWACKGGKCGQYDADCNWIEKDWPEVPDGECVSCQPSGDGGEPPVGQEIIEGEITDGTTCSKDNLPEGIGNLYDKEKNVFAIGEQLGVGSESGADGYSCTCTEVDDMHVKWSCQNLESAYQANCPSEGVLVGDCPGDDNVVFQVPSTQSLNAMKVDDFSSMDSRFKADFVCEVEEGKTIGKWFMSSGSCKKATPCDEESGERLVHFFEDPTKCIEVCAKQNQESGGWDAVGRGEYVDLNLCCIDPITGETNRSTHGRNVCSCSATDFGGCNEEGTACLWDGDECIVKPQNCSEIEYSKTSITPVNGDCEGGAVLCLSGESLACSCPENKPVWYADKECIEMVPYCSTLEGYRAPDPLRSSKNFECYGDSIMCIDDSGEMACYCERENYGWDGSYCAEVPEYGVPSKCPDGFPRGPYESGWGWYCIQDARKVNNNCVRYYKEWDSATNDWKTFASGAKNLEPCPDGTCENISDEDGVRCIAPSTDIGLGACDGECEVGVGVNMTGLYTCWVPDAPEGMICLEAGVPVQCQYNVLVQDKHPACTQEGKTSCYCKKTHICDTSDYEWIEGYADFLNFCQEDCCNDASGSSPPATEQVREEKQRSTPMSEEAGPSVLGECTAALQLEPGVYEVSSSEYDLTTTRIETATGNVRFFIDNNRNGIKDSGEEYTSRVDQDSIKVSKDENTVLYDMKVGWNLVSFPIASGEVKTAKGLIDEINLNGGYATHVSTFESGKWVVYSQRRNISFSDDFGLLPGVSYFVRVHNPTKLKIEGNTYEESVALYLYKGWNMVGVVSPDRDYTAGSLIDAIVEDTIGADTVTRWQSGRYQNFIKEAGLSYGDDFKIFETGGYFIRVKEDGGRFVP